MGIKIVFFDVDGTLASNLDHSIGFIERIPQSAKDAIIKLKQQGIIVAIATGRSYTTMKVLQEALGIQTLICSNGTLVIHEGEVLDGSYIPTELVESAINTLKHIPGINIYVETPRADYSIGVPQSDLTFMGENLPVIEDVNTLSDYDVFQVVGNGYDIGEHADEIHPDLFLKKFGPHAFDISLKGINKGVAVQHVLDKLNILPEEAMAFGDEENDLEMFNTVGLTVAMGESNPVLKACATYITKNVEEDGIHHALCHFGFIDA